MNSDEPATRACYWPSYSSAAGSRTPRAVRSVSNGNGHDGWAAALEESSVLLEALEDEYGGMVVDADRLPSDAGVFARSLAASLFCWKSAVRRHVCQINCHAKCHLCLSIFLSQGKKGVWLKLPLDRSEFIPLAVKVPLTRSIKL